MVCKTRTQNYKYKHIFYIIYQRPIPSHPPLCYASRKEPRAAVIFSVAVGYVFLSIRVSIAVTMMMTRKSMHTAMV